MKEFIRSLIRRYIDDGVGKSCAALAYYLLFSFFPFLVFLSMLLGFLNLEPIAMTAELAAVLPAELIGLVNFYIEYISSFKDIKLLIFGLFFTLFFSARAVEFLMQSVRRAYGISKNPGLIRRYTTGIIFTVFILLALFSSLVLVIIGRSLLTYVSDIFQLSDGFIQVWSSMRFVLLALMLFLLLALLYRVAPGRDIGKRCVFPGVIAALASWLIISVGFSFYVDNFASYSVLYGSIGAIIVLLLWLFMSGVVIIMGAEVNGIILEHRNKVEKEDLQA